MADATDGSSFEELDALLEQAYALDGDSRASFIEQLPEEQRTQIQRLMALSSELTVSDIAAGARAVVDRASGTTSSDPQHDPAEPGRMSPGRWRLHRELGAGGMGQVFFATRKAGDGNETEDYIQEAAIKIMWSRQESDEVRTRFLRERRILATLSHPGLARFIDGGFLSDGRPWFAMEYVDGVRIDEYAAALSLPARLRLFIDVCASVAYAHQHLIVHRDIKPQNVLVDRSGHARLLDFGVAGVLDEVDHGELTRASGTPMTLQYASPEQVSGAMVTVGSDIYQLGLLLYKLLTGVPPYDLHDTSLKQALQVICEEAPPRPSVHDPKIATDLDAIVMAALSKQPEQRYRTATAFAEDVQRLIDGYPVRAMPESGWYVARRFLRRHALIASIVGISVLALSAATAVSIRMANEASRQATRSETAQQILSDVFQKADPFEGQGATVTLADALTRARPEIDARVADDPLLAWEVHRTLAQIYESLGLVEEEMTAYQAMLDAAAALGDSSGNYFLTGVAGLGSALARTNPVEAVKYFDENLPLRPESPEDVDAWLSAQYSYVGALNRVREYGRADSGTFQMAAIMDEFRVTDARKRGRLSQLQASVARRAGDRAAEDRHWREMVEHMRQADNPSALAVTLNNWAIHLGRQKRYEESEAAFLESMAIFENAGLQDPTFASVMRGYAGLLFRTDRIDEAITTTERSLALLPASSQFYARFVGELNLVQYAFVSGNAEKSLDTITRSLPVARRAFADDPSVPQRMLLPFVKILAFGRAYPTAMIALGHGNAVCTDETLLFETFEALEHPGDQEARQKIWNALGLLRQKGETGDLAQNDIDEFVNFFESSSPSFFDALDQWRVLSQLITVAGPLTLSTELTIRYETLQAEREKTESLIADLHGDIAGDLAHYLGEHADVEHPCP